jgi:hypothetical protein
MTLTEDVADVAGAGNPAPARPTDTKARMMVLKTATAVSLFKPIAVQHQTNYE